MSKKIIGIYKITCTVNNKSYVGQSIDIRRRFTQHKTQTTNRKLKEDFKRYGMDAFKFDILEECSREKLTERENYYIDTLKPEYNILIEGQSIFVSDETRQKQRQAKLGKKLTPDHCAKIGRSNTGKSKSEETRRKHFKAIRCIETGQIFESVQQAADFAGVKYNCISAVVHGRNQSSAGFHWELVNKERASQNFASSTRIVSEETRKKHSKSVRCVETGQVFESLKAASAFTGISSPNISAVLYAKQTTAGGYHWEFIDKEAKCDEETRKRLSRGKKCTDEKFSMPIRCIETGIVYESVSKAAEAFGVNDSDIVVKGLIEKSCGYHWKYVTP